MPTANPLAAVRAGLKAKPHVVTSIATPGKSTPLSSVRQSLKSGAKPTVDPSQLNVADRLNRLEHIVGKLLTASPDAAKIQSSLAQLKPATEAARL